MQNDADFVKINAFVSWNIDLTVLETCIRAIIYMQ